MAMAMANLDIKVDGNKVLEQGGRGVKWTCIQLWTAVYRKTTINGKRDKAEGKLREGIEELDKGVGQMTVEEARELYQIMDEYVFPPLSIRSRTRNS